MKWAGHAACTGKMRNSYNILVGNPERKREVGKPERRWEGNIRMDLKEKVWDVVDWIYLAQDMNQRQALVNTAKNLRIP
jgi:hypothetical protein